MHFTSSGLSFTRPRLKKDEPFTKGLQGRSVHLKYKGVISHILLFIDILRKWSNRRSQCKGAHGHVPPLFTYLRLSNFKVYMHFWREEKQIEEESKKGKGGARRYKTPSPQLLRMRRQAANARERRRMNSLNDAFDQVLVHSFMIPLYAPTQVPNYDK